MEGKKIEVTRHRKYREITAYIFLGDLLNKFDTIKNVWNLQSIKTTSISPLLQHLRKIAPICSHLPVDNIMLIESSFTVNLLHYGNHPSNLKKSRYRSYKKYYTEMPWEKKIKTNTTEMK
jgi:hypothetical protein